MTYGSYTETRSYNTNLQLTRQQVTGTGLPAVDLQYTYSTSQNNGRITQASSTLGTDPAEVVTYQYDVLNRLSSASATGATPWSYTYAYDGFGNRTQQGGQTLQYNNANNRLTSTNYTYDANGNLVTAPLNAAYSYDVENRLTSANLENYVYDPSNQRICKEGCNKIHFYGVFGELLGTYSTGTVSPDQLSLTLLTSNVYFAGRLVTAQGKYVVVDRLGSVRSNSAGDKFHYYPSGEQYTTDAAGAQQQNQEKFGTYYRDATGLDYAKQRYYSSIMGRFLTPDPYKAGTGSGDPADPQSWNRYAYVGNAPINFNDPAGLAKCIVTSILSEPFGSVAEIQCASAAGSLYAIEFVSFSGSESQAVRAATQSLGAKLDRDERANFLALIPSSIRRVQAALERQDCAKDFANAAATSAKAATAGLTNQGDLRYNTGPGGRLVPARRSPAVGRYNPFTGSINLNSMVNWEDPDWTMAIINNADLDYFYGIGHQARLLEWAAANLGLASITAKQFMDLTIVHELAHYNGVIGNPDLPAVERALWTDCIK
jgi:RHS repeat-associated protein